MAIINTGQTFTATDTVTNTKLEDIADAATFNDPVDETTLELIIGGSNVGKLGIKDAGVTTSKVLDSSITKAKIENISAPLKVLGRTTAGAGVAEEVTINDDDDLSTASAITLATDESIKAYIDQLKPNIVQAVKSDTFVELNPNNSWIDIPDLSVSITPKFSNSKIFVQAMVSSSTNSGSYGVVFKLLRDTTDIALGDADGNRTRCSFTGGYSGQYSAASNGVDYLDSPSLTVGTPVVYKLQCTLETTVDIHINRTNTNNDANETPRPISTLTVTEIYQ
jgi:hypothetical protein